jgi:MerR-like DNA binding protein
VTLKIAKSNYRDWYQKNKQRLSQRRKTQYATNAEYRQRALEASRRRRRGERTPPTPPDAKISLAQAAEQVGIGTSTLREWLRKEFFPDPKRHNGRLWFTENQVSLLKMLKDYFKVYRMRPWKIKQARLNVLLALILANWN